MTDLDRQLQAILADPDDDGARLAYADLLEEAGKDERAEFIRAQCLKGDLSYRLQYAVDKHGWQRIFGCGRVLQDVVWAHKERTGSFPGYSWGSSPPPTGPGLYKCRAAEVWVEYTNVLKAVARRGFIEHLTIGADTFLQVADALLACQPVTEVTLTTWPEVVYASGGYGSMRVWLRGGDCREDITPQMILQQAWDQMRPPVTYRLLAAEFPRVRKFYLPGD